MIPNIDSKPTMKTFKGVSGVFVTVNFDGKYLTWVKIPQITDMMSGRMYNAYCFHNNSLGCFDDDTLEKLDYVAKYYEETRVETLRRGVEKLYSDLKK